MCTVKWFRLFVVLTTCWAQEGEWSEDAEDLVSTVDVDAVLGRTASLPCDVTPDANEDRVYMVLWFRAGKNTGGKPIYSFDVRGRSFNKALQWSDPNVFGPRAYFATVARPASLTLDTVQLDDEGVYRCRVDFKNSPTRNFQIRLSVIVPPHQLILYDKSGRDVSGVVGPLEEGNELVLVCEVRGGRPSPTVIWLIDGVPAPQYIGEKSDSHVVVNKLELPHIKRSHLNTTFKCRASNTNLVSPQEKTVRLEMNLRPTLVQIAKKPATLSAERHVSLSCVAEGSRPPAQLTWFKDNRKFTRGKVTEAVNDTWVSSTIQFTPLPEDDGVQVKCQADNSALPGQSIEDSFKLDVVYPPVVSLSLGSTLNPDEIKEGDDVYFECSVRANPKEHRITWYHNNKPVGHNVLLGVIVSTKSLVLQKVTRDHTGDYSCRASNSLGETASQTTHLSIQFAPVCTHTSPQVLGAQMEETLRVSCSVTANPPDVTFFWQFNNSGESLDVSPSKYVFIGTANGSTSELIYKPQSEREYGALSCRGTNSVGRQLEPCIFQIVPAARPAPPRNCSLQADINGTDGLTVLYVRCVAGYDGGLPQSFVLQALDPVTNNNKYNITVNDTDGLVTFKIDLTQLSPGDAEGATVNLLIYAKNLKGDSEKTLLENIAFNDAARRTDGKNSIGGATLGILVAAASGAALAAGGIALAALFARRKRSHPPHKHPPGDMLELSDGGRRYVVAYTIKPSPDSKTPEPQPDILNAPDGESQNVLATNSDADEWTVRDVKGDWSKTGAVFSAEDLALLDTTVHPHQVNLTPESDITPMGRHEDLMNQNLSQPLLSNSFRPSLSPTLGSPNFVCPNGNIGSPFGSQTLTLSGPTLSSGSLATSTLHRKGKSNVRRREHVLAENLPGPESCV
ncbi:synaptogenesis protein syg-2-like isoform X1 [Pieris napi]|uniref:synaptogenesis protein syg-2-like isoform X1 n=1 Tax=Pieris napi TaxID=78633 RepID=UPI001FBB170E|nr:synaptogenesis protein syg-2-like isoform X1 [Pieris napi]XP_047509259.1 synaptogenesis protein syg-2-like isoform X1 [Pieris napi]XP_047509267.1 synaptogenesis protein syg-2-like isoform X1 [Pieris napi]XP_047509276.1 synaptogenesis protein syg-2-like isoform X1 [Pieris napi]XP_047509283.1 synaptogenesis protein syg-2-like isoform X1 [Pieris napi]